MSIRYVERASNIVESFKSEVGEDLSSQLTDGVEARLTQMIAAAMASEVDAVIDKFDQFTREVRQLKSSHEMEL